MLFHFACLCWYIYEWHWHMFNPAAQLLKGAQGFGWFFRYLTFCGFTVQTIMLAFCVLDDSVELMTTKSKKKGSPQRSILATITDDVACIAFPFANVVSLMFYAIFFMTNGHGVMDPSETRPW